MTDKEIIQALRICSRRTDAQTCTECPLFDSEDCMGDMMIGAAGLIERLTAENAELREKQRWISVTEKTPEYDMPQLALNADNGLIHGGKTWRSPTGCRCRKRRR